MKRREFIGAAAAFVAAGPALAGVAYAPGVVAKALQNGETVFLDFFAPWCTTCRAQRRVIDALKAANPAYEQAITFVEVDWDTYRTAELTRMLKIPRRSTLVVLKGNQELGRIVAGTGQAQIKALMDTALTAAVA